MEGTQGLKPKLSKYSALPSEFTNIATQWTPGLCAGSVFAMNPACFLHVLGSLSLAKTPIPSLPSYHFKMFNNCVGSILCEQSLSTTFYCTYGPPN